MRAFYTIAVVLYGFGIRIASLFNGKAARWIAGRKGWYPALKGITDTWHREQKRVIWFHCASLGEFEQGRPLMEALRQRHPGHRILVSFFSPSGYEIRKGYPGADAVVYLPLDTPSGAARWIKTVQPSLVFFIKYEYWFNLMLEMEKRQIPLIFISAVFRPDQIFFQPYGGWFLKRLAASRWIFVQRKQDEKLLLKARILNVSVSGDARFDRVFETALHSEPLPLIERFCERSRVIVAGSNWPDDDRMLIPLLKKYQDDPGLRFILAPHVVNRERIMQLRESLGVQSLLYADLEKNTASEAKVLIIDRIGLLSGIYRYAYLAFIGGAFGSGLHNILEAAAFGVPVLFGPKHHKFWEAAALIEAGGAWSITRPEECAERIAVLLGDGKAHQKASSACRRFVGDHAGATAGILSQTENLRLI